MKTDSDSKFNPTGKLVIKTQAMPADTNPSGDIFGGWLLSQMDLGGGIAAMEYARSRVEVLIFPLFCRDNEGVKLMKNGRKTSWIL